MTMQITMHENAAVDGEASNGPAKLYAGLVSLDKVVDGLEAFLIIRAHIVQTSQYAAGVWQTRLDPAYLFLSKSSSLPSYTELNLRRS